MASAPIAELHKQGLPFNPDEPRSVQADLAHADNLQRCMTVFHDFDERLLTVLVLSSCFSVQQDLLTSVDDDIASLRAEVARGASRTAAGLDKAMALLGVQA